MNKDVFRQATNVLALVLMLVANGLATALPLNGRTTAEISDGFPVYFVPAGYVFSIWGLIYLGMLGFAVYQALPAQRENPRLRRIGSLFALGCVANSAWIFCWHYQQFPLSLVATLIIFSSLLVTYLRLGVGEAAVSVSERWLVDIPFSVYLGWVTVATIANATVVLYALGWGGWGISAQVWAALLVGVAALIAMMMRVVRRDVSYPLVIIWALVGIVIKQAAAPTVALSAGVAALLVVATLVIGLMGALPRVRQLA